MLISRLRGHGKSVLRAASPIVSSRQFHTVHMGATKKTIHIDIVSDTVCPWCYVGKKRLEQAMERFKDDVNFEIQWRPYMLNPHASKEGVDKMEFYAQKFGAARSKEMMKHMSDTFRALGLDFQSGGMTGSSLNSHRLLCWAAHQGLDKQNRLAEELFKAYSCREQFINDPEVLMEAARRAGLQGAQEIIKDESAYLDEVHQEIAHFSEGVNGVPSFIIGGQYRVSGAQDPAMFICILGQAKDAA